MQNVIQSTNEPGDGVVILHIYNGDEANEFIYYEDDGTSYNYEGGAYYKRTLRFDPQKKEITLSAVEGSYRSKYLKLQLVLHGFEGVNLSQTEFENINEVIRITY